MKKEENILITGGAGYIGSHVSKFLKKNHFNPIVIDNLSTGNKKLIKYGNFIKCDISNKRIITKVINDYNIKSVIHFAAFIQVEESVKNPYKYYYNNSIKTINFIKTCIKNKIENFVFSSTAAVYGIPKEIPVSENSTLNPINPYGKSKMISEMFLKDISQTTENFRYVALRYFNVAGADREGELGQIYKKPSHLITLALKTALGEYPMLKIFGTDYDTKDGTAIRDYIYIEDLADAHLKALKFLEQKRKSGIYNCGYGKGYSVKEIVNTVKRITGKDFKVINSKRRAGDPPMLIANSEKIKKELGWKPKFDNIELIIDTAFKWEKKLMEEFK